MNHSQVEINAYLLNEIHATEDSIKKDILKDILDTINGEEIKPIDPEKYLLKLIQGYCIIFDASDTDEFVVIVGTKYISQMIHDVGYIRSVMDIGSTGDYYFAGYPMIIDHKNPLRLEFRKRNGDQFDKMYDYLYQKSKREFYIKRIIDNSIP